MTKIKGGTRIARRVLRFRSKLGQGRIVGRVSDGYGFLLDPQSEIEVQLYLYDWFEKDVHDFVASQLAPGKVFVDIGANIGCYTLQAAAAVGESGKVLAFEPLPAAFERLKRNLGLNRFDRVTLFQGACCDRTGSLKFYMQSCPEVPFANAIGTLYPSIWYGRQPETCEVAAHPLDQWLADVAFERVDLIKIDAEGSEFDIIKGGFNLLRHYMPVLVLEVCKTTYTAGGWTPEQLGALLTSLGYSLYELESDCQLAPMNLNKETEQFMLVAMPSGKVK